MTSSRLELDVISSNAELRVNSVQRRSLAEIGLAVYRGTVAVAGRELECGPSTDLVRDSRRRRQGSPGTIDAVIAVESSRCTQFLVFCHRTPFVDRAVLDAVNSVARVAAPAA